MRLSGPGTYRNAEPDCGAALATKGRPGRDVGNGLWSALQTHLQGVDGTTLAIEPEIRLHGVILLSR
ncbi:hypothetical protein CPT32_18105 [Rhizobium sophoriradicis]|nr:hypothetical protein CPT32_18105 [Rhizobium sophoriradicis]